MSAPHQATRQEDKPRFFTIEGLASSFGISVETIRKYITWGHVDYARGRRRDGFNYDMDHYNQLRALRAQLAKRKPLSQRPRSRSHTVIVARGGGMGAAA